MDAYPFPTSSVRQDVPLFLQRIYASQQPPPQTPGTPVAPLPLYLPPPALPAVEEDLVPPENFATVSSGVYRSGFPMKKNFRFMETLRLKTVLTLVLEDYPEANLKWCQSQDIQFMASPIIDLCHTAHVSNLAFQETRSRSITFQRT
jgi:hypothetical protein